MNPEGPIGPYAMFPGGKESDPSRLLYLHELEQEERARRARIYFERARMPAPIRNHDPSMEMMRFPAPKPRVVYVDDDEYPEDHPNLIIHRIKMIPASSEAEEEEKPLPPPPPVIPMRVQHPFPVRRPLVAGKRMTRLRFHNKLLERVKRGDKPCKRPPPKTERPLSQLVIKESIPYTSENEVDYVKQAKQDAAEYTAITWIRAYALTVRAAEYSNKQEH